MPTTLTLVLTVRKSPSKPYALQQAQFEEAMNVRIFKHLLLAATASASGAFGQTNGGAGLSVNATQGKPAYLVVDTDIKDEERFEREYVSKVIPLMQTFGGCQSQVMTDHIP